MPRQPGTAAGRLRQGERARRGARAKAERISRLLARSSVVTTRYFRERISLSYREPSS
jgi:hypothetical protein